MHFNDTIVPKLFSGQGTAAHETLKKGTWLEIACTAPTNPALQVHTALEPVLFSGQRTALQVDE